MKTKPWVKTTITTLEWRWATIWALLGVLLTCLPYLAVAKTTPPDLFYTGFLTNPEDGQSYLAKMRQGQRGEWRFTLPYTADPHLGVWVYGYYLALGHLARALGFRSPGALIWFWHAARAFNSLILLLSLYYAIAHWFDDLGLRRFAFALTALGGGLGWLVALLGRTTVDLWVPEGYIWYSMLANPHFPLATALALLLVVWSVTPWGSRRVHPRQLVATALCALALGWVQPLALLPTGAALAAYTVLLWIERRRPPWHELSSGLAIALAGGPFVLYAYQISVHHPTMALWAAQNQTPSPPPWDYALGYGIVLLLALVGLGAALRRRRDSDWLLVAWTVTTAVLLYLPFSLQRRLVIGWIVPLGMLATRGWDTLHRRTRRKTLALRPVLICGLAALTPLFLISISVVGAQARHAPLFIESDEKAAIDWLAKEAPAHALVIAGPDTGLYIPAWAGQRVWYGHRFETAHAEQRRAQLVAFYRDGDRTLLDQAPPLRASYVWYGPREAALSEGRWAPAPDWPIAFHHGSVTLYALPQE